MDKPTHGVLFDLDNTLIDREGAFARFASCFYEERLRDATTMPRAEAVMRMVHWDQDGFIARDEMFARWVDEWPEAGLELVSLLPYYRSEMGRHVQPDSENNGLLADLSRRGVPWGIVTNGNSTTQHMTCRASGSRSARSVHHRVGRGWLQETRPKDLPRRIRPNRSHVSRPSPIRR